MFKIIFEGTKESIEEKINNPFWGTIILTWLTWNWKVWYVTLFVSEEKIINQKILNKIDYIKDMYNYFDFYHLFPLLGFIFNWILMPLILTTIVIFFINPKISIKFLEKHDKNKTEENKITIKKIKAETEKIIAETSKIKTEENIENKKYKDWDNEIEKLIKNNDILFLQTLEDLIYKYSGRTNNSDWKRLINIQDESKLDSLGLIENLNKDIYDGKTYGITEKGKYFIKNFSFKK